MNLDPKALSSRNQVPRGRRSIDVSHIFHLRESIDGVVNYKIRVKNEDGVKHGRKVVDKEAEVYDKLLTLPSL